MIRALLASLALVMATQPAHATGLEPFIAGLVAGIAGTATIDLVGSASAYFVGAAIGAFLATPLGLVLISGVVLAASALLAQPNNRPRTDAARFNVRIEAGPRRTALGKYCRCGGNAAFGEYDAAGNFWYIIYHCDSELMNFRQYLLDDLPVTIDGSNRVTTAEFTIEQADGGTPYLSLWTVTFAHNDPVPALPAAFLAAFPSIWTSANKLAGTTLTVVKFDAMSAESRVKLPIWRGAFGMGEPWVSIVGDFGRIPDPRAPGYLEADKSTWGASGNPALLAAWWRMRRFGFAFADINWTEIAAEADKCDQLVTDKYSIAAPRYECGLVLDDDMANIAGEQEILKTCDGLTMFDDQGRYYIDVGYWEEPSVTLSAARDIMGMAGGPVNDGEAPMDGVVVRYLEPSYNYIITPAAPWLNPDYYQSGRSPRFLEVEIQGCHNHNQAVRLEKAIGERSQSLTRLGPQSGLRGLLLRRLRTLSLAYPGLDGTYEIYIPTELDPAGFRTSLGLVPVTPNRWDLLAGEEGDKPPAIVTTNFDPGLAAPTNMVILSASIAGSGGNLSELRATWDALPRLDRQVAIEYQLVGDSVWLPFPVILQGQRLAYTASLTDGLTYHLRYRTETATGRAGNWSTYSDITTIADTTPPGAVTGASVTPGTGTAQFDWTAPNSTNYSATRIYTNAANDFATATLSATEAGAIGVADSRVVTLAAGTWYGWLVAINGSGVEASPVATGSFVVA